ncbi:MAG: transglutaminase domain-containing protein [Pirellulaceae bacterium]|nr:transglutaminase domain-containing protein [Pirellulaceae bacterium]
MSDVASFSVNSKKAIPTAGLQSAYWICRLFVIAQVVLCVIVEAGERGRVVGGLVVVVSIVLGGRFRLSKSLHTLLVVCSGGFFACIALSMFFGERNAGILDLFELLAEYLIIVQSLELLRRRAQSLSSYCEGNYLPGLGTIAIIMLLVTRETQLSLAAMGYLFTSVTILLTLVMRPDFLNMVVGDHLQRRKAMALATIVALGTTAGSLFQSEVTRQLPVLQAALRWVQPPRDELERVAVRSQAKLVDRVDLTSVSSAQRNAPDELVFRVQATQQPGYMRTLSFEKFDGTEWTNAWSTGRNFGGFRRVTPLDTIPFALAVLNDLKNGSLYEFPERRDENYLEMKISVPAGHGRQVPLPLASAYIWANSESKTKELVLDAHGNVWPSSMENGEYRVFAGSNVSRPLGTDYAMRLLQLPNTEAEFVRAYAAEICGGELSTTDKVQALQNYFTSEFEYSFEGDAIGERLGRSPLRAFLENRQAGHCEYFATASVLLLRSQGVPCRLSTGYLVFEMNDDREYYFARNRDAHAWAEAYDEASGVWILVESTPGIQAYVERYRSDLLEKDNDGPEGAQAINLGQSLASSLWAYCSTLQTWWSQLLATRFSWLIPLLLGGVLWLIRTYRVRKTSRDSAVLSAAIRKADKRAQRLGYQRAAHETCLQFAQRLSEAPSPALEPLAEWYVAYSQSRYLATPPPKKTPEQLTD